MAKDAENLAVEAVSKVDTKDALSESLERFQRFFEMPLVGVCTTSPSKGWLEVNDRLCQTLGFGREELFRLTWAELTHPEDLGADLAQFERVLRGEIDTYSLEKRFIRKDGIVVPTETAVSCVRKADGSVGHFVALVQDVTGRKRAEEALRESERALRETQALGRMGSYVFDFPSDGWSSSTVLDEIFGIDAAYRRDVKGWLELVHPAEREAMESYLERLVVDHARFDRDYRIVRRANGEERWVHGMGILEYGDDGAVRRLLGTILDITDRKAAETLQTQLHEDLVATMSALPDLMLDVDREGRIFDFRAPDPGRLLAEPKSFVGKRVRDVLPADAADVVSSAIAEAARAGRHVGGVYSLRMPDGVNWFELSIAAKGGSEQGRERFVVLSRDITERKRAAAEIERMNRLYAALIQVNEAIVKARERDELFREVCRVLVEVGGFKMARVGWHDPLTRRVATVAGHGDDTGYMDDVRVYTDERPEGQGPTGTAIREGRAYVCNDFFKDPRTVPWREAAARASWRSSAAFPIWLDGTACGALTVYALEVNFFGDREVALLEEAQTDLSYAMENFEREQKRRQAEREVLRLNAELEQRVRDRTAQLEASNKELEAFSYSVSHDLRAPLRAIEGFSAMVVDRHGGQVDAEGKRLLGVVRKNAKKMARLIDDLLGFSRLGRSEMRLVRLDMTRMARLAFDEIVGSSEPQAKVVFELRDLPEVDGDAALIGQVWFNLLSNAVKFSTGKETPEIRVDAVLDEEGSVIYRVQDNGAGFDMAYSGKLFGVFQRLHAMDEFEGTGVGLALVRRIVSRHGGRVWAEGAVDRGATISFSLPVRAKDR